ncbi:hypothetical protein GCM10027594_07140 [Hymenobacter agri]
MRQSVPEATDNLPNQLEAALLSGIAEHYQCPALAAQIATCRVALREYSGCGFFTTLIVPDYSPLINEAERTFTGSDVAAGELSHGAGSILFVQNGRIHFLEVFAYADGDPAAVTGFTLQPIS